jgi:cytochrome P450
MIVEGDAPPNRARSRPCASASDHVYLSFPRHREGISMASNRPTVDFDHHSSAHANDPVGALTDLRAKCPMAWSTHYGGFWVATSHGYVSEILLRPDLFSSAKIIDHEGVVRGGVDFPPPPGWPQVIPGEVDPPSWHEYRRLLAKAFAKPAINRMEADLVQMAACVVDDVIETGRCDMAEELAWNFSGRSVLSIVGLPSDEWEFFSRPFHDSLIGAQSNTSAEPLDNPKMTAVIDRLKSEIAARAGREAKDVLGAVINGTVDGRAISADEALRIAINIVGGGIDTTASLISLIFVLLEERPELRDFFVEPTKAPLAIEECMRYFSPTQSLARRVVADTSCADESLTAGESVLVSFAAANRDPLVFEAADSLELDRSPNPHLGWGLGIHKCLGMHLARAEIRAIVAQVLTRMPDYSIEIASSEKYPSIGILNGYRTLPATFTPGSKAAAPPRAS